ncbi:MAG TPA: hypothetical protein VFF04_03635 [Candidatus Babeliales bacterium]|nr:hypothetical protein [Candidatus Babeliales bacterium]
MRIFLLDTSFVVTHTFDGFYITLDGENSDAPWKSVHPVQDL